MPSSSIYVTARDAQNAGRRRTFGKTYQPD